MSGGFRYSLKSPSQAIFGKEIVTWALDQSISPPHDGDVCDYLHNQSVSLIVFLSSLLWGNLVNRTLRFSKSLAQFSKSYAPI